MKQLWQFLSGQFKLAANAVLEAGDCFVTFTNEFKDDGELTAVQLAPFGRFPNVQGLQVFTPSDAKAVANSFVSNAKMALGLGLPWYVGHPDHPLHKERYKDTRSYGRIKGLEARTNESCPACQAFFTNSGDTEPCREHGLFAKVKFNERGKKAIANEEFHGHSVNWRLKKVGNEWHPFDLKSVGFTNEPNIPVPSIMANEWVGGEELVQEHFKKLAGIRLMMANETSACGSPAVVISKPEDKRTKRMANMRRKKNLPL